MPYPNAYQYFRTNVRIILFFILAAGIIGATAFVARAVGPVSQQTAAVPLSATTTPDIAEQLHAPITAQSAIVWDIQTDTPLFEKRAEAQIPLASITKLMLGLVARETLAPDQRIRIDAAAIQTEGDSGLRIGETWAFRDLLAFTLVASSNDGAHAIAAAAGESLPGMHTDPVDTFVAQMNTRAQEIGLSQTYFLNPTGLDTSTTTSGAYGSARDVALLLDYLTTHHATLIEPTRHARITLPSGDGIHTATNTNDVIPLTPGLIGSKTGFTDLAGGNLAIVFDAGIGRPVAVVVLGSTYERRFADVVQLVRATLETFANTP